MSEQDRKAELARMTGGLRCRCPGFQKMTRVECRGFEGVRFCYFACEDPQNPGVETLHPVGGSPNCRCSLGTKKDPASTRFFENEEAPWGFSRCLKIQPGGLPEVVPARERPASTSAWPVAIGIGALLWFVTTQGR